MKELVIDDFASTTGWQAFASGEAEMKITVEAGALPNDLDARLEAAVARQLRPLREQLDGYENSIRVRDVMGGIGYLFGLAGLIVMLKHRKARRAD